MINAAAIKGEQDEVRQKTLASILNGAELAQYSNEFVFSNIDPNNPYDLDIDPSTSSGSRQQSSSSSPQHESTGGSGDTTKATKNRVAAALVHFSKQA